jgi:hypothetical protein
MARQTGRVTVSKDGTKYQSKAGASMQMGGETRTENGMTDQGTFFYKEMLVPGMVKCTLIHMADTDLEDVRDTTDATVQYETDTGLVYTLPNAVCSEIGELASGEVEITFVGLPMKS